MSEINFSKKQQKQRCQRTKKIATEIIENANAKFPRPIHLNNKNNKGSAQ
jgi:hypothetical protein